MKKHLIAAAVAAAVAAPAMAQVTVYGTLEVGIERNDPPTGSTTTTMDSHEFVSNRLGFRGEEDLGGGLKAHFRLETGLNTSEGDAGTTASFFSRGAEIGLSGAFGRVSVGKLDHAGIEGNDDLLLGNLGLGDNAVELSAGASDVDDTISYTTPAFNGFTLNVTHTFADNGSAAGVATTYNAGGTDITTGHEGITSYQIAGRLGPAAVKLGGGTAKGVGAAGDTKIVGGSIRMPIGPVTASLLYQTQDNPGATADAKNTLFQVRYPLGGGLDVGALYEDLDIDGANNDIKTTGLMVQKALSKRTSVYGLYRNVDREATGSTKTLGVYLGHSF